MAKPAGIKAAQPPATGERQSEVFGPKIHMALGHKGKPLGPQVDGSIFCLYQ